MKAFCAWCDDEFVPRSPKQIYCGAECRQLASKGKILERYHLEKRKKRLGKTRLCGGGCGTPLSIYNDVGKCDNCIANKKKMKLFLKEMKDYFDTE